MPYKDPEKQKEARARYEEKRKAKNGTRHRAWTMIFYPDSAPPEWADYLSDLHVPIWVSPLHDQDVWTEKDERENANHKAGTPKKPHYHLICQYEVQVDRQTFLEDMKGLNGSEYVKAVKSLISMVRYLVHADDPDKAQYSREDVRVFGGAEIDLVEQLGSHERHEALKAMRRFIREHGITQFYEFVDYCDDCEESWARLLDDNSSYVIEKYIKSRYLAAQSEMRNEMNRPIPPREYVVHHVDPETGEITDRIERG